MANWKATGAEFKPGDRDTIPAPPPEEADPASMVAAELRRVTLERDKARAELRALQLELERIAARFGWF
jgi:hypothetical protein